MFVLLARLALATGSPAPAVAGLPPWTPEASVPAALEGAGGRGEVASPEAPIEVAAATAASPGAPIEGPGAPVVGETKEPVVPFKNNANRPWEVGGFIDVNYGYNSNRPDNHVYRGTSVQPRTGEFSFNHAVAYIRRDAIAGRLSPLFELAVQGGPAADALVASEPNPGGANGKYAGPEVWKHIARANVGLRTRGGTELVAGLQLSPIGIGVHWSPFNWNYTVTWQLNSVPYYLSGIRLSHTFGARHTLLLWLVNGWQLLADNNQAPSVMLGYRLAANERLSFAEYVWIGPEQVDMRPQAWRLFSDSQFSYETERFGVAGLFDVGAEPRTDLPARPWQMWMSGAIFTRWRVLGEQRTWDMGLRPELFWDRDGRMFGVPQALVSGTFTNNFRLVENLLLRVEYRYDHSTNPAGFFYRGAAISDGADGLARDQHTVFFSVAGVLAHRFGGKRG